MQQADIRRAVEQFEKLLAAQIEREERIAAGQEPIDYGALDAITIGVAGGDGIGPVITKEARGVLASLLTEEVASGKVRFEDIEGLTLETRLACGQAIPDDVLAKLKACHVILKGPTTTPQAGSGTANIESANVRMRKELDLYANVRPVKVPDLGIDWVFFRENTEGAYALGSEGIDVTDGLAIDFTVTTSPGTLRIARMAYEYARKNGKGRVSLVTKANVIKKTDGKFLTLCHEVAKDYPEIVTDEWYADIVTAKLIDEKRRRDFRVFLLPNLYGDIISDEAAEFMGGVGTAGGANLGDRYAMFEAIHGSAPRMVEEGREQYADPASILRAGAMLLSHIGYQEKADRLERALDYCMFEEPKAKCTGRPGGATASEFAAYVTQTLKELQKA